MSGFAKHGYPLVAGSIAPGPTATRPTWESNDRGFVASAATIAGAYCHTKGNPIASSSSCSAWPRVEPGGVNTRAVGGSATR